MFWERAIEHRQKSGTHFSHIAHRRSFPSQNSHTKISPAPPERQSTCDFRPSRVPSISKIHSPRHPSSSPLSTSTKPIPSRTRVTHMYFFAAAHPPQDCGDRTRSLACTRLSSGTPLPPQSENAIEHCPGLRKSGFRCERRVDTTNG